MKNFLIKLTSAIAVLSVAIGGTSTGICASLGSVYHTESSSLAPGLDFGTLYSAVKSSNSDTALSGELRSYVFTYQPGSGYAIPTISWGEYVHGRETLDEIISHETTDSAMNPLGALNGDFFSMQTGVPMGVVMRDGRVVSNGENVNALVIAANSAYIAQPQITLTLTNGVDALPISYLNKYPTEYGAYLLTSDYGETTTTRSNYTEVVLDCYGDSAILPNSNKPLRVVDIRRGVKSGEIPVGCMVLTYVADSPFDVANPMLASLEVGDELTLSTVTSDDIAQGVSLAVGGGDLLLKNGVFDASVVDEAHEKQKNPRTAVGVTADGRVIFYACDGRSPKTSDGLTLEGLAQAMLELGCVDAMNLDGGGSTTVVVGGATVNSPSDGKQRAISDAVLFLENPYAPLDATKSLAPSLEYSAVIAGGGRSEIVTRLKSEDRKVGDVLPSDGILYEVSPSEMGRVENGVFIAGDVPGIATITATCDIGEGKIYGSTAVHVMGDVTKLTLTTSDGLLAADGRIMLDISAFYRNVEVGTSLEMLEFSDETIGTLMPDGTLVGGGDYTALERPVTISATAGGVTSSLKLTYGIGERLLSAFESVDEIVGDAAFVYNPHNGTNAIQTSGRVDFEKPIQLKTGAKQLMLTTQNGVSGYCVIEDANGDRFELPWVASTVLYRHNKSLCTAELPLEALQPVKVVSPMVADGGTVVFDDLSVSYGALESTFDDTLGHWAQPYVDALCEMGISDSVESFRPDDALTRGELARFVVSYFGLAPSADSSVVISDDVIDEAILPYAVAAIENRLMTGWYVFDDGSVNFNAEGLVTRAQAMQVFGSLLDCTPVELAAFADAADMPDWAATNAAKTVASGVITGYPDGTLCPGANITRGEFAVMLTRFDTYIG